MAIVQRRYFYQGVPLLDLQGATDPGLTLSPTNYRDYFDVTFDDAIVDQAAVDERMTRYGLIPDPSDTLLFAPAPFFGLVSPIGNVFQLAIDDAGVISTIGALGKLPVGTPTIFPYSPGAAIGAAISTFVGFGTTSLMEDAMNWVVPRSGVLTGLRVSVPLNTLALAGPGATFTIRRSVGIGAFADTALSIAIGAVTGVFSSVGSIDVAAGDRLSLSVTTTGLAGVIVFSAGLDVG